MTLAAVDPAPTGARRVKALVRRVLRPVVVRIRWVAARLDLGGAAQAETASRGVASLRAAIATLEVTVAEQAESIDELRAEVAELRARLDSPADGRTA